MVTMVSIFSSGYKKVFTVLSKIWFLLEWRNFVFIDINFFFITWEKSHTQDSDKENGLIHYQNVSPHQSIDHNCNPLLFSFFLLKILIYWFIYIYVYIQAWYTLLFGGQADDKYDSQFWKVILFLTKLLNFKYKKLYMYQWRCEGRTIGTSKKTYYKILKVLKLFLNKLLFTSFLL